MTKQEEKKNQIIELAIKRFSRFGIHKTTMDEIASDNGISKTTLYSFFPDKSTLICEALKSIVEETKSQVLAQIDTEWPILKIMHSIIEIKEELISRYYLFFMTIRQGEDTGIQPETLKRLNDYFENTEFKVTLKYFKNAASHGEITDINIEEITKLYVLALNGIECQQIKMQEHFDFPEQKVLADIFKYQRQITTIFINGLRHPIITN